ncbi:MAG: phospholipase D family protein [Verrucomicrobiae bacterium]|nr:phospholipase D family protein [Verrucomicrobiae bacterium]
MILLKRFIFILTTIGCIIPINISATVNSNPKFDIIVLRTGEQLQGYIVSETEEAYRFTKVAESDTSSTTENIPRLTVAYVLYADVNENRQKLGLDVWRNRCSTRQANAELLTSTAFGDAILKEAESATRSIYVLTYYLIDDLPFTQVLKQKAKLGVEVVILCPFDAGTMEMVRRANIDSANLLSKSGIKVRFTQSGKIMHKKLVIFDKKKAVLGSSNITGTSTTSSFNMNLISDAENFVKEAVRDFEEILSKSKEASELTY